MTCHSQIWTNSPALEPVRKAFETGEPLAFSNGDIGWNVVNKVPEFVYFDHSIHLNRGVSCNQCHGPVQEMQITYKGKPFAMSWCLECHRDPAKFVYADPKRTDLSPREQIFELYRKIQNDEHLTPREHSIAQGNMGPRGGDEVLDEKQLEELYKLKKKQLEDCWTCHR
jgi:cytochrome c peroxidase